MFCQDVKNTLCKHGRYCLKWGCGRIHPEGRIVGFDCQHDGKCWGQCELHHNCRIKNSDAQNQRIHQAASKIGDVTKLCNSIYKSKCTYGEKCLFRHEAEPEPEPVKKAEPVKKKRKATTCSMCKQTGHNKISCWIAKLPPPPPAFLM